MKELCRLLALLVLVPACSSEVGISVKVLMNTSDWDARWPIEHIRLEAIQGDVRALGCLYPMTSVPTALVPEDMDELACANAAQDLNVHPIDSNLGPLSWGLEAGRTVNFRLDTTEPVTVIAHGNFGNRLDVFLASGSIAPTEKYPQLELRMEPARKPFLATQACPLELDRVAGGVLCTQDGVGCLFPADLANRRQTEAVVPVDNFCRVDNRQRDSGCGNPALDQYVAVVDLFDTPPIGSKVQIEVKVRAHFARCASGPSKEACRLDVGCSSPRTEMLSVVRQVPLQAPSPKSDQIQDLQCMPATATPVDFHFGVAAVAGSVNVGVLAQAPATLDTDRCFLDIHDAVFVSP